jgi:glycosyltransferase involved in cell wall biosynthesis
MRVLGEGLSKLGYDVDYFSPSYFNKNIKFFIGGTLQILKKFAGKKEAYIAVDIFFKKIFMSLYLVVKQIKNEYTIINAQDVWSYNSTFLIRKIFRVPVLLTVHTYYTYEIISEGLVKNNSFSMRFLIDEERKAYKSTVKIISVDRKIKEYIVSKFKVSSEKINVIKNFVNIDEFYPQSRNKLQKYQKKFKIPSNKKIILCARRLVPKNGVIYAAFAAKILKQKLGDTFVIVYAGDGPEKIKIEEYIKKNDLQSNVMFLGAIPHNDMKFLYNLADVVIIPSVNIAGVEEATSITALEAMASGVPVIASRIGGLVEIIDNGTTGFLVKERDPEELSNKIIEVLNSDISSILLNARENIVKNYSHTERARKFLGYYEEIISQNNDRLR